MLPGTITCADRECFVSRAFLDYLLRPFQVEVIRGDDAHNPLLPETHISYYCAMMCHHTSHMSNPVPKGGFRTCVSAYAGQ